MEAGSDLGSELTGELPINLTLDFEHAHVSGYFAWRGRPACRRQRDLALAALRKALTMRRPTAGLIHHSDRGSQGGFKRWSQHGRCLRIEATDQVSLPAFSNRASFGVGS